ncbi:hypothetical protein SLEP1_g37025 [Rubroshorea leprosula]|uniref:Uncharacterized protein n=1 Tax=Rubroshorea leprosula TaxID=152421 RepID=A0AAV5KTY3_9ROSI|nr:hypothetical protein SLEP1_g37025 [Rubroshorea leprosula]
MDNQLLFKLNTGFVKSFSALMLFEPKIGDLLDCCNVSLSTTYATLQPNNWLRYPMIVHMTQLFITVTLDVFSSECGKWLRHPMTLETTVKVARWIKRSFYLNGVLYR